MKAIYEPKGRAGEYAPLAVNLFRGCLHGCSYCYAPGALRMTREDFHARVAVRPGILEALGRDAARLAGDLRPALLCFSTDPYQPAVETQAVTSEALKILLANRLTPVILTKAGERARRDFDLLAQGPAWFGQSFTLLDSAKLSAWEPSAAPFDSRLEAQKLARQAGISTWASLEPVISPKESLEIIRAIAPYTDHFKVGRLNHIPWARELDWPKFRREAETLLQGLGYAKAGAGEFAKKTYYLKIDLVEASERMAA